MEHQKKWIPIASVGCRRSGSRWPIGSGNLSNPYNIALQAAEIQVSKVSMKLFLLMTVAAAAVLFSSCNTMIGFGRDLRIGGEGLEKSANKVSGGGSSGGGDTSGAPVY